MNALWVTFGLVLLFSLQMMETEAGDCHRLCEWKRKKIECSHELQRIRIDSAQFFRNDSTTCTEEVPEEYLENPDCPGLPDEHRTELGKQCDDSSECTVKATYRYLTDPCEGTFKWLDFCYSCVYPVESVTICEWKTGGITCEDKPGTVIEIERGFWGRMDRSTCVDEVDPRYLQSSTCPGDEDAVKAALEERCNGEESCSTRATNRKLGGDPCVGVFKYAIIEYRCVEPQK